MHRLQLPQSTGAQCCAETSLQPACSQASWRLLLPGNTRSEGPPPRPSQALSTASGSLLALAGCGNEATLKPPATAASRLRRVSEAGCCWGGLLSSLAGGRGQQAAAGSRRCCRWGCGSCCRAAPLHAPASAINCAALSMPRWPPRRQKREFWLSLNRRSNDRACDSASQVRVNARWLLRVVDWPPTLVGVQPRASLAGWCTWWPVVPSISVGRQPLACLNASSSHIDSGAEWQQRAMHRL